MWCIDKIIIRPNVVYYKVYFIIMTDVDIF